MKEDNIDKFVKSKIENTELAPTPKVWDHISQQLKRRRQWRLAFWATLLLLAIGTGGLVYKMTNQVDHSSHTQLESTALSTPDEDQASRDDSDKSRAQGVSSTPSTSLEIIGNESPVAQEQEIILNQSKTTDVSDSDHYSAGANLTTIKAPESDKSGIGTSSISRPHVSHTELSAQGGTKKSTKPTLHLSLQDPEANLSTANSTQAIQPGLELQNTRLASMEGLNRLTSPKYSLTIDNPPALELRLFDKTDVDCPKFSSNLRKLSLDLFTEATLAMTYYQSDPDREELRRIRENTESGQSGYGFGMRLAYDLTRNVRLRSGLMYTRINEDFFLLEREVVDRDISEIRIDTVILAGSMDTIVTYDTTWTEIVNTTTFQQDNQYEFLDIPIEAGYQWNWKKWYLGVYGGVVFNLAFDKKGALVNAEDSVVTYDGSNDSSPQQYKDRLGVMLSASAQVGYEIYPGFGLYLEPHTRYTLDPLTVRNAPVDKKFQLLGLRVGARVSL